MAFPAISGTATFEDASGTSLVLTISASAGERLILLFGKDGADAATGLSGTGWSQIASSVPGSASQVWGAVYEKLSAAGSADDDVTISYTAASEAARAILYRITGSHASSAAEAAVRTHLDAGGANANPDPPSLTVSWSGSEDTKFVAGTTWDSLTGLTSNPTDYTSDSTSTIGTTTNDCSLAAGCRDIATGTQNPGTFTIAANQEWVAWTVGIRPAAGAGSHATTGALAAAAATVAGTATHLTLHATSGALSAQAASVAGSALHPHLSTGALTAQSATVAGSADVVTGGEHPTTGALAAAAATVAGDAAHLTLHTTTGALSAQSGTVAGSAAHLTLHTTTGALTADPATVAGVAAGPAGAVTPRLQPAGRPSRTRRARVVEIDGEDFIVNSAEEAEALLESAREQARQLAATAVKRAAAAERRPVRKVIADARRLLETPEIRAPEDLQPMVDQARADIDAIYQSALASVEIAALMARRQREEEDDEDVLMLIA